MNKITIIIDAALIGFEVISQFWTQNITYFFRPEKMGSPRRSYICGPLYPYDSSLRTCFTNEIAKIYAWPSRGGVIVLEEAEAMDFQFLGLDPLAPPMERFDDQSAEDAFYQQLLLLGAKW